MKKTDTKNKEKKKSNLIGKTIDHLVVIFYKVYLAELERKKLKKKLNWKKKIIKKKTKKIGDWKTRLIHMCGKTTKNRKNTAIDTIIIKKTTTKTG